MSNVFETEVSRSLRALPGWSKKLATPAAAGPDTEQRFNLETEFDHIYNSYTENLSIECKKVEDLRFPFKMVKDHQETGLLRYLETAGPAYLLVNFRLTKRQKVKFNRAFAVGIVEYLAAKKKAAKGEFGRARKSLRIEWFCDNATELRRIKLASGYGWDLSVLLRKGEVAA